MTAPPRYLLYGEAYCLIILMNSRMNLQRIDSTNLAIIRYLCKSNTDLDMSGKPSDFAILVPASGTDELHRTLSMLVFQQEKDFHVYVIDPAKVIGIAPVVSEFEMRLSVDYLQVDPGDGPLLAAALPCLRGERYVCWLSSGVEFTPKSLLRMRRCIKDHPDYDVYHWNLEEPERKWKLKTERSSFF